MIVICKKGNKSLIKGHRYKVDAIFNDGKSSRWIEGKVKLDGISKLYNVANFTDIDGKKLPQIQFGVRSSNTTVKILKFEDIKKGDILVCNSDRFKTLLKNGLYRVEDCILYSKMMNRYDGTQYPFKENYIKLQGVTRKLKFNSWIFRKLSTSETREIALGSIFGEDDKILNTDFKDVRKIDYLPNKEEYLLNMLALSIMDPNRHAISIVEWACQMVSKKVDIIPEDYNNLLDMSLRDVLSKIDK